MGNQDWPAQCSSIEAGFNVGGLRSHHWLIEYSEYLLTFYPKATIHPAKQVDWFTFLNHHGRDSDHVATIHIWVLGECKPVPSRWIRGKGELLSEMDIVCKLGLAFNFKMDKFNVCKSGW